MSREEAIELLDNLVGMVSDNHDSDYDTALKMAIKALSQEPCDDTVSIRKDVLKFRVGNIVAYNVEWLKKHWQMEMDIVCGIKPCDDVISREAVLEGLKGCICEEWIKTLFATMVKQLPSVTQKSESVTEFADRCRECGARYGKLLEQKSGHWISHYDEDAKEGWYECDRCHTERAFNTDYCPDCGAKMESEVQTDAT